MIFRYTSIFWQLLITDLMFIAKKIKATLIDTSIWVSSFTAFSAYILPILGTSKEYGPFMLVGSIVTCGVFQIFGNAAMVIGDLDGDNTISYEMTLPIPSALVWIQKACSYAIHSMLTSLVILPLGKLILLDMLPFSTMNWALFPLMFVTTHLLTAFLTICLISLTPSMQHIEHVWTRFLFPLWFFGGTQFSWQTLFALSPKLAWLSLANPMMYATEGIRSCFFNPAQSLSPWLCLAGMWVWIIIFGYIGISRLQKRLDSI